MIPQDAPGSAPFLGRVSPDIPDVRQAEAASTFGASPSHRWRPARARSHSLGRPKKPRRSSRSSLFLGRLARLAVQPFLSRLEAGEAGHRCAAIDRLPLGVKALDLKLVDSAEEVVGEAGDALVTVSANLPVVG